MLSAALLLAHGMVSSLLLFSCAALVAAGDGQRRAGAQEGLYVLVAALAGCFAALYMALNLSCPKIARVDALLLLIAGMMCCAHTALAFDKTWNSRQPPGLRAAANLANGGDVFCQGHQGHSTRVSRAGRLLQGRRVNLRHLSGNVPARAAVPRASVLPRVSCRVRRLVGKRARDMPLVPKTFTY
jgi:hypothetical protein